jgi:hypothetical protein
MTGLFSISTFGFFLPKIHFCFFSLPHPLEMVFGLVFIFLHAFSSDFGSHLHSHFCFLPKVLTTGPFCISTFVFFPKCLITGGLGFLGFLKQKRQTYKRHAA